MEPQKRSIRVPADNCPECLGVKTTPRMAVFELNLWSGSRLGVPTAEVSYQCHSKNCLHVWTASFILDGIDA